MKNVVILGSTGSIGTQTLDIIDRLSDRLRVVGLAANSNVELVAEQANARGIDCVCIGDKPGLRDELSGRMGRNFRLYQGVEGMCSLAGMPDVDLVVMAVAGAIGILPTQAGFEAGK